VLANKLGILVSDVAAHEALILRSHAARVVRKSLSALSARDRGEVANGLVEIYERLVGLRPERAPMSVERDQDQSLTMLRDSISKAVEDAGLNAIPKSLKRLVQTGENSSVIPTREVRDILNEHRRRTQPLDDGNE
jgi:hypothetical protein